MVRPLPYPGHTWSFTQHAVGLNAKTIYDLLKCASPFEGEIGGYDEKITALMVASDVLTPNQRNGKNDAWRDYQQLLAELGLIYSTRICRALTLTNLGHMFLAGEIGFSELVGVQSLRYQYPNGQKTIIQNRLRNEFDSNLIEFPETLTELQTRRQLLIKPGTLILRVLLELNDLDIDKTLSIQECQTFLLPCRINSEWTIALSEIIRHRRTNIDINHVNHHAKRNIQDWFKFLLESDFFRVTFDSHGNRALSLSNYALSNISMVREYCESQELATSFWIPQNFDRTSMIGWFDWFGQISFDAQKTLRLDVADNQEYLDENYIAGIEDDDDKKTPLNASIGINLSPIDLDYLSRNTAFEFTGDINALAENLRKGAQKRHAKTLLHDRIIKELAENFISQGATVEADPDSIDLFATWPSGSSALFEVKTVTRRSLQGRIRSAVGQIEEYAYRRQCMGASFADRIVVINTDINENSWQAQFLTKYLGIGLICRPTSTYSAFAPTNALTSEYWLAPPN